MATDATPAFDRMEDRPRLILESDDRPWRIVWTGHLTFSVEARMDDGWKEFTVTTTVEQLSLEEGVEHMLELWVDDRKEMIDDMYRNEREFGVLS